MRLRGISKRFGPVQANRDISLDVQPGTIHGIIGDTGYMAEAFRAFAAQDDALVVDFEKKLAKGSGPHKFQGLLQGFWQRRVNGFQEVKNDFPSAINVP